MSEPVTSGVDRARAYRATAADLILVSEAFTAVTGVRISRASGLATDAREQTLLASSIALAIEDARNKIEVLTSSASLILVVTWAGKVSAPALSAKEPSAVA